MDLLMLIQAADRRYEHLQACDGAIKIKVVDRITEKVTKIIQPCRICQEAERFFSEQSALILSALVDEVPAKGFKVPMIASIVESTFMRGTHKGKKAQRDLIAGMRLLREYQEAGGRLPKVFS